MSLTFSLAKVPFSMRTGCLHPLFFVAVFLAGCGRNEGDSSYAAEAAGEVLTWSEVASQLPENLSPQDSAALATTIINDWRLRKLWLEKAEAQLGSDLDSFEVVVQRYREDLLILSYQNRLAQQEMDTAFTESELQAAYVRNKEQFQLGVDIVRVSYLAVPATAPWSAKLRNALVRGDQNPPENLVLFAKKWARQYRLADTGWVELPDLAKQLGLPAYQPEALLRLGYKDWTSGSTRYLLQIHALKRASTTVPFPLAKPWVKALLLERRKKEYWKRLEAKMLEDN